MGKGNVQEAIQIDQYLKWLIKYLICFHKFESSTCFTPHTAARNSVPQQDTQRNVFLLVLKCCKRTLKLSTPYLSFTHPPILILLPLLTTQSWNHLRSIIIPHHDRLCDDEAATHHKWCCWKGKMCSQETFLLCFLGFFLLLFLFLFLLYSLLQAEWGRDKNSVRKTISLPSFTALWYQITQQLRAPKKPRLVSRTFNDVNRSVPDELRLDCKWKSQRR